MALTQAQLEDVELLGADSSTVPDLDEAFGIVPAERTMAEICARRLSTPNGSLPGDLPFGFDLRSLLNAELEVTTLEALRSDIEAQLLLDERIESLGLTLTFESGTLLVVVEGGTAAGPFSFVLEATSASVELLGGG